MNYIKELLFLGNGNFTLELILFMYIAFTNIKKKKYFYPKLIIASLIAMLFYFVPSLDVGFFNFVYVIAFTYVSVVAFCLYKTNFNYVYFAKYYMGNATFGMEYYMLIFRLWFW